METQSNFNLFIQDCFDSAEYFFLKPSPEEKPFDNKYRSREILESLLKNPNLSISLSAYINYLLGINYLETEETSQGENLLKKSLVLFSELDEDKMEGYLNVLQDIYNNLGLMLLNREEIELGMGCLAKAELLYESLKDEKIFLYNSFQGFVQRKNKEGNFEYYADFSSLNLNKTESYYTLTQFYLAQAYTKIGQKEKAAFYCGSTMKRQYENQEFVLKEWCVNSISLSEFYQNNRNFAQAFYLLQAGDSLLPLNKKRKLRATFQMSLARLFNEYLKYMVEIFDSIQTEFPIITTQINKKFLVFETLSTKFTELEVPKDYEGVAKLFRMANTQYKKALSFFVLDGYVTENVEMTQEMSSMMKHLCLIENDSNRRFGLLEKRKDLLEPLQKQLNPKAYASFSQKLLVELAEIYNDMFENRFQEYFMKGSEKIPKKNRVDLMNGYGFQCIKKYEEIENILNEQQKEQKENTKEYCQSIINTRFNIAKAYNKIYGVDKAEKVEFMKKSLENYRFIVNFIRGIQKTQGALDWGFAEQVKVCQEMVELIPAKIEKIMRE